MTVIFSFEYKELPFLAGDLLLSGMSSKTELNVPTIGQVEQVFPNGSGFVPLELRQKVNLISDNLAIAWAGDLIAAIVVIKEIEAQGLASSPSKSQIEEFVKCIDSLTGNFDAFFIFLGLDNGEYFFCFHGVDNIAHPVVQSLRCIGTGREEILSLLRQCFESPIGIAGQPNYLALGASLIMALAGASLQKEIHDGGGLLDYFGGGYEVITRINGKLKKVDEFTYVFWNAQRDEQGEVRLQLPYKILKYEYLDNYLIIRSATTVNGKAEDETLNLISPVHNKFKGKLTKKMAPDYNSRFFVHLTSFADSEGKLSIASILNFSVCGAQPFKIVEKNKRFEFLIDKQLFIQIAQCVRGV